MADRVSRRGKRKTLQLRGMFVWIIVFYFYIFLPYEFYKKRLQTLFKDQLDRSKATCSFKTNNSNACNGEMLVLVDRHKLVISYVFCSTAIT